MQPPNQDIDNRAPVWEALSNLFLDTDLEPYDYEHIARACDHSPYSLAELEAILFNEVWPVFKANLSSVAGEWAGWNRDDIVDEIIKTYKTTWRLPWYLNPRKRSLYNEWSKVKAYCKVEQISQ